MSGCTKIDGIDDAKEFEEAGRGSPNLSLTPTPYPYPTPLPLIHLPLALPVTR